MNTVQHGVAIIARDGAERVLIVAPAPLTVQWQEEMREKFDRNFVIYDRETVRTHRKSHPNQNVWTQEDLTITSEFSAFSNSFWPLSVSHSQAVSLADAVQRFTRPSMLELVS